MRRLWLTGRVYDIIQLSSNFMKDSYLYLCTNFPRSSVAFFFFLSFSLIKIHILLYKQYAKGVCKQNILPIGFCATHIPTA